MFQVVLRQNLRDTFRRVVAAAVALRLRPIENNLHALLHAACGLGRLHPDRRQHLQYVGRVNVIDTPPADVREDIALQRGDPLEFVPLVAKRCGVLGEDLPCRIFKYWDDALLGAPLGQGVAAGPGDLAQTQRFLAGLGQRHQARAAQAEVTALAVNRHAHDPFLGAIRIHD